MWLVIFDIYDKPAIRTYKHDLELVLLSSLGWWPPHNDCLLMAAAKFNNETLDCRPDAYTNNPHNKI
jgi:hypothetical protein